MTRRREWHVVIGRNHAYIRGYGTRELLIEMRGRPPLWSRRERSWTCQPSTAYDVIAVAERRGIAVHVKTEHPVDRPKGVATADALGGEPQAEEVGLW